MPASRALAAVLWEAGSPEADVLRLARTPAHAAMVQREPTAWFETGLLPTAHRGPPPEMAGFTHGPKDHRDLASRTAPGARGGMGAGRSATAGSPQGTPRADPLEDLGLAAPALVVGQESVLDSGRIDLVLLANGGELVLVEFKTGPQNPDFRECLAQLLDYGSDLWGMTLEDFDTRVARRYFAGPHFTKDAQPAPSSLEAAATKVWGSGQADAVDWRERLQSQLRDGSFHYIAVAQRFTRPVLRTVEYLNATMKAARFSAVELVRFSGGATAPLTPVSWPAPVRARLQSARKRALPGSTTSSSR